MKRKKEKRNFFKKINKTILFTIIGFLSGVLISSFILLSSRSAPVVNISNGEEVLASFGNHQITANSYFKILKETLTISPILNEIDKILLDELIETTPDMKKVINDKVKNYLNEANSLYGIDEQSALIQMGISSKQKLYDIFLLQHKQELYYNNYVRTIFTDKQINDYYKKNVYGDMSIKYIVSDDYDIIIQIIDKLNNNVTYNTIIKNYKKKITSQFDGYISFDSEFDEAIKDEAEKLKDNSYSKKPIVVDDTKYAVVIKGESLTKSPNNIVRERIIDMLSKDFIANDDSTLNYKALIDLRKEKNLKFFDATLNKYYNNFVNQYK